MDSGEQAARLAPALADLDKIVAQLLAAHGTPRDETERDKLAAELYPYIIEARRQSHVITAAVIREQAQSADEPGIRAAPLADYGIWATEAMTGRALAPLNTDGLSPMDEMRAMTERLRAAARMHALAAGRDLIADTAGGNRDRRGRPLGWARVLVSGKSCAFCAMLASRGPVYRNRASASRNDLMRKYHPGCECKAVLVFPGRTWEGQDDYEQLERLWESTGGRHKGTLGYRGDLARNDFRRAWERGPQAGQIGPQTTTPDP